MPLDINYFIYTRIIDRIKQTFFVSNCDILIDQDYSEVLKYHQQNKNVITVVAALKHYKVPYGVIESGDDGLITSLVEKPDIINKINTVTGIMLFVVI